MTKLRVGILMNATIHPDTEVTPHIGSRLEFDSLNGTNCGLETFIRVLSSDTGSNDVGVNRLVVLFQEVNRIQSIQVLFAIKPTDLRECCKEGFPWPLATVWQEG
jgi:hypothetical protein